MNVRASYDAAAEGYGENLAHELAGKPLDRALLDRFAEEVRGKGLVADLGCGPGHVTRYLQERGLAVIGVDLSPGMITVARRRFPDTAFLEGDLLHLHFTERSLAGVVLFYAIVHFDPAQVAAAFAEAHRVLQPGALALVAYHVGDEIVHVDELFGAPVQLDFRYHAPAAIAQALDGAGFDLIEATERAPYAGAEHPTRRCYQLARAR